MDVPANQWYIILHVKQTLLSIGYGNSRGIVPIIVRSRIWESLAFRSVSQSALCKGVCCRHDSLSEELRVCLLIVYLFTRPLNHLPLARSPTLIKQWSRAFFGWHTFRGLNVECKSNLWIGAKFNIIRISRQRNGPIILQRSSQELNPALDKRSVDRVLINLHRPWWKIWSNWCCIYL